MSGFAVESAGAATAHAGGRDRAVFAGCDYLGLAHEPEIVDALRRGLERYGVSAGASRATTGNAAAHEELEHDLARFLRLEAALLVPDGYLSNLVAAQGIGPECRTALVDREAHVSFQDALAAADIRVAPYDFLSAHMATVMAEEIRGRPFAVCTDGVYPVMRGIAPLRELLALVPRDGWLVVDDCHATGVLGERGRGTHDHCGISDPRLVVTGTLSKALGCFGGFVAGTRGLVETLRSRSRAFTASTPIPPALALAGSAAVRFLERDGARVAMLSRNVDRVREVLQANGVDVHRLPLPVFAWKATSPDDGRRIHELLLDRGILVPHVTYPDGLGSYFRLAVSAAHTDSAIDRLDAALQESRRTP